MCSVLKSPHQFLEFRVRCAVAVAVAVAVALHFTLYCSLYLSCALQANQELVKGLLPDGKFSVFVDVLRKFLGFIKLTVSTYFAVCIGVLYLHISEK